MSRCARDHTLNSYYDWPMGPVDMPEWGTIILYSYLDICQSNTRLGIRTGVPDIFPKASQVWNAEHLPPSGPHGVNAWIRVQNPLGGSGAQCGPCSWGRWGLLRCALLLLSHSALWEGFSSWNSKKMCSAMTILCLGEIWEHCGSVKSEEERQRVTHAIFYK